jgi:serine/threonine protein kinase
MSDSTLLNYKIITQIGEGGMGKVYLAEDTMLDKKVAIKILNAELTKDSLFLERFKQEAKIQSKLLHPCIVTVHNLLTDGQIYFIVMEYAEGITLKEMIMRLSKLDDVRALKIFGKILDGVYYAHSKGIIHRDIKPSNIIVDMNDDVKIMDFGIAKILGERGFTRTGSKVGTLYYMSPEQIDKPKDVDNRTDLYSLGVVLYEMITGKLPYSVDTDSDFKIMSEIIYKQIPDPRIELPNISEKTAQLISILTQKDKEKRFKNCEECIEFIKKQDTVKQQSQYVDKTQVITGKAEITMEQKPKPMPVAEVPIVTTVATEIPESKPVELPKEPEKVIQKQPVDYIPQPRQQSNKKLIFIPIALIILLFIIGYFGYKYIIAPDKKIKSDVTNVENLFNTEDKIKSSLDNYLSGLYSKAGKSDTNVIKSAGFSFKLNPENSDFPTEKYNPFTGKYTSSDEVILDYSSLNITNYSNANFSGKYKTSDNNWEIDVILTGKIDNNKIVLENINYAVTSKTKTEEINEPENTTEKINKKPEKNNTKLPEKKEVKKETKTDDRGGKTGTDKTNKRNTGTLPDPSGPK